MKDKKPTLKAFFAPAASAHLEELSSLSWSLKHALQEEGFKPNDIEAHPEVQQLQELYESSRVARESSPWFVFDCVYELIAEVCKQSTDWVDLKLLVSLAVKRSPLHETWTPDMIAKAVQEWESLHVVCFNHDKTMVRFIVPPV